MLRARLMFLAPAKASPWALCAIVCVLCARVSLCACVCVCAVRNKPRNVRLDITWIGCSPCCHYNSFMYNVCACVSDGCVYCGVRVCGSCFMAYFAALPLINIKSVNNNSNKSNKGASRRTLQKMLGWLATFSLLSLFFSSLYAKQNAKIAYK